MNGDGVSDWTLGFERSYGDNVVAVALGPFVGDIRLDEVAVLEMALGGPGSSATRVDDVDGNGVMDFLITQDGVTLLHMNPSLHAPGAR